MLTDWITHYWQAAAIQAQTTYVRVAVAPTNAHFRLDFRAKKEWRLKPGALGTPGSLHDASALTRPQRARGAPFLTSRSQDPAALFAAIAQYLDALSQGWRDLPHYLCRWNRFRALEAVQQSLREGSDVRLYYAPASIAKAVIAICQQQGVTTKHLGTQTVSWLGLRRLRV